MQQQYRSCLPNPQPGGGGDIDTEKIQCSTDHVIRKQVQICWALHFFQSIDNEMASNGVFH